MKLFSIIFRRHRGGKIKSAHLHIEKKKNIYTYIHNVQKSNDLIQLKTHKKQQKKNAQTKLELLQYITCDYNCGALALYAISSMRLR